MQLFIDTANVTEIIQAKKLGVLDGVTTNPSLLKKESLETKKPVKRILSDICEVMKDKPVSAEVFSTKYDGMIKEARELYAIGKNIVIKLPITEDGLKACKALSIEGIKTNMTLCFTPLQAILSAKAGATYVSPFVGRLDDILNDGMSMVANIMLAFNNYQYKTEIIVASIRNTTHILKTALIGADIATIPFKVIKEMYKHPKTDEGVLRFKADSENLTI